MARKLGIALLIAAIGFVVILVFFFWPDTGSENGSSGGNDPQPTVVTPGPETPTPTAPPKSTGSVTRVQEVSRPDSDAGEQPSAIEGRVLAEENGAPVAGAVVRLALDFSGSSFERVTWLGEVQTGPAGEFRFEDLRYVTYRLQFSSPGRLSQENFGIFPSRDPLEVRLAATAGIACRVEVDLEEGRQALAGHEVKLEILDEGWSEKGKTDGQGLFIVSGMTEEDFAAAQRRGLIEVIVAGYADPFLLESKNDDTVPYIILVDPGATIYGVVLDRDTGRPIPGASVVSDYGHEVPTDAAGRYRISGVEEGVTAHAPGYAAEEKELDDVTDDLELTAPLEVNFRLGRGVILHGFVTDPGGRPLKDVRVGLAPDNLDLYIDEERMEVRLLDQLSSLTDEKGYYRISGLPVEALDLPADIEIEFRPRGSGRGIIEDVEIEATRGEVQFDVQLDLVEVVSGTVLGADGNGRGGLRVSIEAVDDELFQVTATDRAGKFRFHQLPVGSFHLAVETEAGPALIQTISVPTDPLELRLKPGRTMSGSVLAETDGAPLADLLVRLVFFRGNLELTMEDRTDESGAFSFKDVPPGTFSLEMRHGSPVLPFEAVVPYHRQPVDLTGGDWNGEILYPNYPSSDVTFRFLVDDGTGIRELEATVDAQVVFYQRGRFRTGNPSGLRRGYSLGKASRLLHRKLREGQYTFQFLAAVNGRNLKETASLGLGVDDSVDKEIVFKLR